MDLTLAPDQEAFRDESRAWLARNVPTDPLPGLAEPGGLEAHREWERTLYEAGYAAIHWPEAYGGRGADWLTQALFAEEYARAGAPERLNVLGLGLIGPAIIGFGTPEQKERWLPRILSCEEIWSQGFSEPDAGSDLAGVKTVAEQSGDGFVINGQKIWTTLGRVADWICLLVRTDRQAAPHQGLTMLAVRMDAPGIEVRPIMQINEDAGFSEVFLTDVPADSADVIGEPGDGWRVAMAILGFERGTGLGDHVRFSQDVAEVASLARDLGMAADPIVRDRIAGLLVETEVFRHHMYRSLTRMTADGAPGPEASLGKLYWSEMSTRILEAALELAGPHAELRDAAPAAVLPAGLHKRYWYARASTIYAGTSEIQKNIIAERVLGLPKEPRHR